MAKKRNADPVKRFFQEIAKQASNRGQMEILAAIGTFLMRNVPLEMGELQELGFAAAGGAYADTHPDFDVWYARIARAYKRWQYCCDRHKRSGIPVAVEEIVECFYEDPPQGYGYEL
jgi:hypothetical protein